MNRRTTSNSRPRRRIQGNGRPTRNGRPIIPHPGQFQAAFVVTKTMRFQASSALTAANATITTTNLLDMLCMAVSAVAADRLFVSFKLNSVTLWGPMASNLVPVTTSIEYHTDATASVGSPNRLKSDTSIGSTTCAYTTFRPPRLSLASFWQGESATNALFTLTGPVNTIVDINITFVLQNGEPPVAVANALVGATVGIIYCRGLDGLAAAGTVLPPVSYTTA